VRIGMVATPWYALPPTAYGGIESVCADLVDALVARGHDIVLVGAGTNGTAAGRFVATYDAPQSDRIGAALPEALHAARAGRALREAVLHGGLDIIHDHSTAGPLLAGSRAVPTVITTHQPTVGEHGDYYNALGPQVVCVAVSAAQRAAAPCLPWAGTVHNAVRVHSYPFRQRKGDYALFLGRSSPEKAPHLAIDAARAAGVPIVLAGKCTERAEEAYFKAEIAPRLGADARWVGEADAAAKRRLLAGARCLVFPIQWDEPFGMVMAEALACGTPVVALERGSVPEVVRHGVTGYVCSEPEDLAEGIRRIERISTHACRGDAVERFDVPVMAAAYERVYCQILRRAPQVDLRVDLRRPRGVVSPQFHPTAPG